MYSDAHEKLEASHECLQKMCGLQRRFLAVCVALISCCVQLAAQQPLPSLTPQPDESSTPTAPVTLPPGGQLQDDPCADYKVNKNLDNFILCAQKRYDDFSWRGIRPVIGGVVPGSGLGGGVGYSWLDRKEKDEGGVSVVLQKEFKAEAKVTVRKYWQADASFRIVRSTDKFQSTTPGASGIDLPDLTMNFYGQVKDMPRLDFFGLGPETDESGLAKFHYRESVIGADISRAFTKRLDIGGAVEGIWPRLTTITDPSVRPVEQAYNEQTAPGLFADPTYLRVVVYVGLHSPGQTERRRISYDFFYNVFYDWKEGRYSFRRFDADLKHKFRLGDKSELRVRGRLSFSETRAGQRVPFYLQETLGGSNIRSEDTLRGFRDYRFRDRNFALLQTDFMRELYGPIKFIAFYDVGKVARNLSNFDEGRLRQTFGLGVVVMPRQLDKIMFRFYIALGSGEGSHIFFGPGESLLGGSNKLVR